MFSHASLQGRRNRISYFRLAPALKQEKGRMIAEQTHTKCTSLGKVTVMSVRGWQDAENQSLGKTSCVDWLDILSASTTALTSGQSEYLISPRQVKNKRTINKNNNNHNTTAKVRMESKTKDKINEAIAGPFSTVTMFTGDCWAIFDCNYVHRRLLDHFRL